MSRLSAKKALRIAIETAIRDTEYLLQGGGGCDFDEKLLKMWRSMLDRWYGSPRTSLEIMFADTTSISLEDIPETKNPFSN